MTVETEQGRAPALGAIREDLDWMNEALGELGQQMEGLREFVALVAHKQEHVLRLLEDITGEALDCRREDPGS